MRALDILLKRSPDALVPMASLLKADSASRESILNTMRSDKVAAAMTRLCNSRVMKDDLALLCANPFDPVEKSELADAGLFERAGFIQPTQTGRYSVNLDMALSMVPFMPLEFGFAATLLARLDSASLASVARALEVGPKPNHIDFLLDIAMHATDHIHVTNQIARLNQKERLAILDAVECGELPDDPSLFPPASPNPLVSLEPGEVGRRGLVFWIEFPSGVIPKRPLVAYELLSSLEELLEKVPLPPETVAARSPRRSSSTTGRRATPARKTPVESVEFVSPTTSITGSPSRMGDMARAAATADAPRMVSLSLRQANVQSVAGVVDLEDPRFAELATRDPELRSAVLEVVKETLVVIRAGFDLQTWAEKAAARFSFS